MVYPPPRNAPMHATHPKTNPKIDTLGIIIAGGQATRMQGLDKSQLIWQEKPFIQWIIERLQPQISAIVINTNRPSQDYQTWHYPVIPDQTEYQQLGPLGGLASVMSLIPARHYLMVPGDSPQCPLDLYARLKPVVSATGLPACAHDGQRLQPLFALIPANCLSALKKYLATGKRQLKDWLQQQAVQAVDFTDQPQAFININTINDYQNLKNPIDPAEKAI